MLSWKLSGRLAPSAIVVERDLSLALLVASVLDACACHVTMAETYQAAKQCVSTRVPDLLVTALTLGEYNGLGLVLRGRTHNPQMAAVIISTLRDPVLQAEAEAMGATFIYRPVSDGELKAALLRTMFRGPDDASGPIRAPFERRLAARRQLAFPGADDRRIAERRRSLLLSN